MGGAGVGGVDHLTGHLRGDHPVGQAEDDDTASRATSDTSDANLAPSGLRSGPPTS